MNSKVKIIFSPGCLEFGQKDHPESSERVKNAYDFLKNKGFDFIEPKPYSGEDILLVHGRKLLENVKFSRFIVLEGGYSKDLPILIYNFLLGLEMSD